MSQKQQVISFLLNLEKPESRTTALEKFQAQFPDFNKNNFKFYMNEAIKNGTWLNDENVVSTAVVAKTSTNQSMVLSDNNKEFEEKTIDLANIDQKKFTAVKSGTAFDRIASKRDGTMPGTVYMVTGESGAGKTTICTNIAQRLEEMNPGFVSGFISAEMDQMDWTEEVIDNPLLANLKTVFMLEYLDAPNYLEIFKEALRRYNFVIVDSFEVILDQLKSLTGWTSKKAEAELIAILRTAASDTGCIIFVIQQYTKGGTYVGSTKLKHLMTGLIYVKFDKDGERFLYFDKNRRGGHMVHVPLYYTKNKQTGRLEFDANKLEIVLNTKSVTEEEAREQELQNEELKSYLGGLKDKKSNSQAHSEAIATSNTGRIEDITATDDLAFVSAGNDADTDQE